MSYLEANQRLYIEKINEQEINLSNYIKNMLPLKPNGQIKLKKEHNAHNDFQQKILKKQQ